MDERKDKAKKSMLKPFDFAKKIAKKSVYIEIYDNNEIVLEGCKGILEYNDTTVKVNTGGYIFSVVGRGINIKCLTEASMVIKGFITTIEFLT